ncbi:MAG TPA: CopG family transcriptional regulator [Candidatus Tyrphobacter sp.]
MRRTQIYLDEDQKRALRTLAAERDSNVSDLVRQAVDRLLKEEIDRGDWAARLGVWQKRIRRRLGDVREERVDEALRSVRRKNRPSQQ